MENLKILFYVVHREMRWRRKKSELQWKKAPLSSWKIPVSSPSNSEFVAKRQHVKKLCIFSSRDFFLFCAAISLAFVVVRGHISRKSEKNETSFYTLSCTWQRRRVSARFFSPYFNPRRYRQKYRGEMSAESLQEHWWFFILLLLYSHMISSPLATEYEHHFRSTWRGWWK